MASSKQLELIANDTKEWGTFKDSLKAPVHRWFTYPAGFSFKAVEHSFQKYGVTQGDWVYDPFMGSGTTNLTAKTCGVNSVGFEAHPFVFDITKSKLNWNVSENVVMNFCDQIDEVLVRKNSQQEFVLSDHFPELVTKCYTEDTLRDLLILREAFFAENFAVNERLFIKTGITSLLRSISSAATGWPYIAPKKLKVTSSDKNVADEFIKLMKSMLSDLDEIKFISSGRESNTKHNLILGSSQNIKKYVANESIDHIFTSPPYLNNFDYSDRTRLELYFWGEAKNWGDISKNVRTKLMTSATTQIHRTNERYNVSDLLYKEAPHVAEFVERAKNELAELRKTKGGKKSYDLMVSGYFNDIYPIIKESYRVLKPNSYALFVLGDSAPYGVHVPTDELIGDLGVAAGFDSYEIDVLRERGGKWAANPQRHSVKLRESVVILKKK